MTGAETDARPIGERVATAPLFGGGTVAVVVDPGSPPPVEGRPRGARGVDRRRSRRATRSCSSSRATPAPSGPRRCRASRRRCSRPAARRRRSRRREAAELAGWIDGPRHGARDARSSPGAAKELARRVGGFVQRGRRRPAAPWARSPSRELDKLALYRPFDPVTEDDVRALVAEVVPDSTWAFLDAVAERRPTSPGPLLDRLLETTPEPVVTRPAPPPAPRAARSPTDLAARRAGRADIVKAIGGHPFRAQKLVEPGARWTLRGARRRARGRAGPRRDGQGRARLGLDRRAAAPGVQPLDQGARARRSAPSPAGAAAR